MEYLIDLRSDTVTRPTPGMRASIAAAEVGDDVFGEDPTVNALEARVASLLGKEAALFMPSGTMANQVGVRAQTRHGDEVIMEGHAHPFNFESGALAALSGVQVHPIEGKRGIITAEQVSAAVRFGDDPHIAPTSLICLENTHNLGGGTVYPIGEIERIAGVARTNGLRMHLDGARLMNACTASGLAPAKYAALFDSVSICLSKGLGAPAGSVLAGGADFIVRARRFRKMFGGGMRQAGILAAAGIHALDNHVERLAEDHANARLLAEGLQATGRIEIDPTAVETNILYFNLRQGPHSAAAFAAAMEARGVRLLSMGEIIRAVTHLDVTREDMERTIEIAGEILGT